MRMTPKDEMATLAPGEGSSESTLAPVPADASAGVRRTRRNIARAAKYGIQLVDRLKNGHPRCQHTITRNPKAAEHGPYQCQRPARLPLSICSKHGGGHPEREARGERENPTTARLTTGDRASLNTLTGLYGNHPGFAQRYAYHRNSDQLLNFRDDVARARALTETYLDELTSLKDRPTSAGGIDSPVARAIGMTLRIVAAGEKIFAMERRAGIITRHDLNRWLDAVSDAVDKFVPANRQAAFYAYVQEHLQSPDYGGEEPLDGDEIKITDED